MEASFIKANNTNLPKVDVFMLAAFFTSNVNFCSSEFRNIKTSVSSRASYGDDAVSYVQLKRNGKLCTVKCKICPEHKVRSKLYSVTLIVDEEDDIIHSIECHDCVASQGGCKHAIAFLMWVHRRSEEPSCTSTQCYWKKSKLSQVGTNLKYITVQDMSKSKSMLPSNQNLLRKFLEEGRKRNLEDCELLRYQPKSFLRDTVSASMHHLVIKYKTECCDAFLKTFLLSDAIIKKIEIETREQHNSSLWHELRYGRITASRAFEVSRCKTPDGTLISAIMGAQSLDSPAMQRGRKLEDAVRQIVMQKMGQKIRKCGLFMNPQYPMIAGSPDGISQDFIIEIKCPTSIRSYKYYIKDGQPTEKFLIQMQLQMYLSKMQKCIFCVADPDFSKNQKVETLFVMFNQELVENLLDEHLLKFWKTHVYPLLYKTVVH